MKPKLAVIDGQEISGIKELKDSEYQEFNSACQCLIRFSMDQQLYQIVNWNYSDYKELLSKYYDEYIERPSTTHWSRMENMVLNVNRHILNFLASVRTFLDHSETNLKKRYGADSPRVGRFKSKCSVANDNSFSYRFMYKLKNYAQHCGMPVGALTLHSEVANTETGETLESLAVLFKRDDLLSKYDSWGMNIVKELEELPPQFEINPHVDEVLKQIEKINLVLIQDDVPDLIKGANYIQEFLRPLEGIPGTPCILRINDLHGNGEQLNMQIEWIPLHLVDVILNNENGGYSD